MPISTTVQFDHDASVWPVQWMSGERLALPRAGITPGRTISAVMTLAGALHTSVQLRAEWPGDRQQTFQVLDMTPLLSYLSDRLPRSRQQAG